MRTQLKTLHLQWSKFAESRAGAGLLKFSSWGFSLSVLALLLYQLNAVGWSQLWNALPAKFAPYFLFAFLYTQLTIAEVLAYRACWQFDVRQALPAFLKKRIYNRDVLGYSGEIFFFSWARRHVHGKTSLQIAGTIRDQNIISSAASTTVALALLGLYLSFGSVEVLDQLQLWLSPHAAALELIWAVPIFMGSTVIITLIIRFRRYLFDMSSRLAAGLFALHIVRLIVGQATQVGFWAVCAPEVPLQVWFTLAAGSIISSRIPLLPNRDLLFVSAGLALSDVLEVGAASIGSTLVLQSILTKAVNTTLFTTISFAERRRPREGNNLAQAQSAHEATFAERNSETSRAERNNSETHIADRNSDRP
ncbi:MAG: hypothetical protein V3V08_07865 [Nannocystaceae bacterium]